MNDKNKSELAFFAKILALAVWGIISIITFAGVLNYCPEPFVKWCAGIVLVMNGIIIWRYVRRLVKEHEESKPQTGGGSAVETGKPAREKDKLNAE